MALKATIYKADLQISDIDRGYYADHALTLAKHPSETEERLMIRLLAFALYADPGLEFGRGLSTDDEPDLWRKDDTGAIQHWIEVGLPDERRLRRAAGRARRITVLAYGRRALAVWWRSNQAAFARLSRLSIVAIADDTSTALAAMASRSMHLQCIVQDGQITFSDESTCVTVPPDWLQGGLHHGAAQ